METSSLQYAFVLSFQIIPDLNADFSDVYDLCVGYVEIKLRSLDLICCL